MKSAFSLSSRSVSPDPSTAMISCDHDLDTQALIRTEEIDRSKLKVKPDSELYDIAVLRRLVLLTQAACPLDVNELNLRRCAINGDADGIKDLLQTSGVNPNAADTGGWSALILASRYGFLDAVRVLLSFGADINQETNEGWTALMYAVYNKHAEIVEVLLLHDDPPLLQHGTKTNAGWTALMYATYIGSREIMEILVHKAEPPAHILFETAKGASAVTCARMKRRKDLKEFLQKEAKFQRKDLVVRGIDSAYGNWVPLDIAKLIAEFTTWY